MDPPDSPPDIPPPDAANYLGHGYAFPEIGAALRARVESILEVWVIRVRELVPNIRQYSDEQLIDSLPLILPVIADAIECADPFSAENLLRKSPAQGVTRFHEHYNMRDLMTEDRLLRQTIIEEVGAAIARPMTYMEQSALHFAVDLMLQQAVIAFVERQSGILREKAEAELKHLSFLSHDLNNNLGSITLTLQVLRQRLASLPEFSEDVDTLDAAQQSILNTIGGMGRLLQSERMRRNGIKPVMRPVNLHDLARSVAALASPAARRKGLGMSVEVAPETYCNTDSELVTIVLQNLVGNAIKFSSKGTVRIWGLPAQEATPAALPIGGLRPKVGKPLARGVAVSVSDEGPGIAERTWSTSSWRSPAAKPTASLA